MKRFFIIFVAILALLLEVAFFSNIKIFGITPNIFLMLLITFSFVIPEEDLMFLAFFGSLFLDLFSSAYFGSQTLIILTILLLVMLTSRYIFSNVNFVLLFVLVAVSTVIFDTLYGVALFFSGLKLDPVFYIKHFLVSKILVNSFIALLFYPLASSVWEKILKIEGRARLLR